MGLLKKWLRESIFSEEERHAEFAATIIRQGTVLEERLEFWQSIDDMLASQPGMAYQALMQRELARLQAELLTQADEKKRDEVLHRWRQMTFVTTYPQHVHRLVKEKIKKVEQQKK